MSTVSFLRQAFNNPRSIASVVPSGPSLGRAMVQALPHGMKTVVELGPGTGPVTKALLEHGVGIERLMAIESNRALGIALSKKYPSVPVMLTDARHLPYVLRDCQWPLQVDAVVSSLPLRALDTHVVEQIIQSVDRCLKHKGVVVQYSYRTGSPVPSELCLRFGWAVEKVEKVWRNIPPAHVYRYTKR